MPVYQWIKQYIKWRLPVIAMYLLCLVVVPAVDFLYHNNMDAAIYAFEIITFVFIVYCIWDFMVFYKKHDALKKSLNHLSVDTIDLPKPWSLEEEDYQTIIRTLYEHVQDTLQEVKLKNDTRMDYFVLWVHQIKTPILALRLLMQSERESRSDLSSMEWEVFRIEQYVDMVLKYLRLDNINNDLELGECDLNPILKSLVKKYAILFIQKKVTLILEEIPETVLSDAKWLSMVIEQGLSNAAKYSPGGTVHIFIEKNVPSLVIEDTGIGIRKEDIKRIFERGFTGFNGRLKEKSTGLGLFLAAKAAYKLGHRLEVESCVGRGTRFRIVFSKGRLEDF